MFVIGRNQKVTNMHAYEDMVQSYPRRISANYFFCAVLVSGNFYSDAKMNLYRNSPVGSSSKKASAVYHWPKNNYGLNTMFLISELVHVIVR